ncbi:hypothetical protein OAS95_04755 [Pelagibacteraceae bacterium]|nr:hypothetical protein [Pelagibacteraceae bacterium]
MKKLLAIVVLGLLWGGSVFASTIKLTCTVSDGSYSDTITLIPSTKKVLAVFLNNRFISTTDYIEYPDTYSFSGHYGEDKIADYNYTINRTTGVFNKVQIFSSTKEVLSDQGTCEKIKNKF